MLSHSHLYKSLDCDTKKRDSTKDCFSRNIFLRDTERNQSRQPRLTSNQNHKGSPLKPADASDEQRGLVPGGARLIKKKQTVQHRQVENTQKRHRL